MKKLLSLVLALVMIVGVIAPARVNAEATNSREELFNKLRTKFAPVRNSNDVNDGILILAAILANKSSIFNALPNSEYLNEKGITEDTINDILNTLIDSRELIESIIKSTTVEYSDISDDLDNLLMDLFNSLPQATKASIEKYADTRNKKIDAMISVVNALFNEKVGTGNYSLSTNKWTSLGLSVTKDQIKTINKQISNDEELPFTSIHQDIINSLLAASINVLSPDLKHTTGRLLYAIKLIDKVEVDKPTDPSTPPSGGGGGGGGGGSSSGTAPTPTTPQANIEVPADTKAPATATVGKEGVTITTNTSGTSTIKVKETETIKIVEDLRKASGKDREAAIVINLDTIKSLDFALELPGKLIEALVKNNVNLEIKTANSEVAIPASTLSGITIPSGAKLELRVAEVPKTEASKSTPESSDIKKVVDLNLVLVKGIEETKITTFRTYITVKLDVKGLGNEDKLAVYYLNEETNTLEFVTGKIENSKAVLRLKHFSKYVILESKLTFEDIKGHWSKLFVESMAAKNVIGGYGDGTFRPEGEITRAEFAKMIVDALELDLVKYDGRFTDVKATDWHSSYVATMVKSGLAGGYGDNTFKPNDKITRAEMAMILGNTLDMEVKSTEVDGLLSQFKDSTSIQEWSKLGIAKAVKAEIMVGSNNNFNPNGTATRGEAATAVYRLYNK